MEKIEGIKLDEFVSIAIIEIANGVSMAIDKLSGVDVLINPIVDDGKDVDTTHVGSKRQVQQLDFDLSVTAAANETGKSGAAIKVLSALNLGTSSDISAHYLTTSRLKFSIPISFQSNTRGITPEEYEENYRALVRSVY